MRMPCLFCDASTEVHPVTLESPLGWTVFRTSPEDPPVDIVAVCPDCHDPYHDVYHIGRRIRRHFYRVVQPATG